MRIPEINYQNYFPNPKFIGLNSIVIVDKKLLSIPSLNTWLQSFNRVYAVRAGESLKSIDNFCAHMEKILDLCSGLGKGEIQIVSVGGGSVGDFSGFVASVLKRGVGLVHMPSTWLAAIDSCHGGKTALNVGNYKNQIGSFYSANKIFLVKELLFSQPIERAIESSGEVLKTAWLAGGELFDKVYSFKNPPTHLQLWKILPALIATKYNIVNKDPYEIKGRRHLLNLGHTLAHIIELDLNIPHGIAVGLGLKFALQQSFQLGHCPIREYDRMIKHNWFKLFENYLQKRKSKNISKLNLSKIQLQEKTANLINQDKKTVGSQKIRFIFVRGPGQCFVKNLSIRKLSHEIVKYG